MLIHGILIVLTLLQLDKAERKFLCHQYTMYGPMRGCRTTSSNIHGSLIKDLALAPQVVRSGQNQHIGSILQLPLAPGLSMGRTVGLDWAPRYLAMPIPSKIMACSTAFCMSHNSPPELWKQNGKSTLVHSHPMQT